MKILFLEWSEPIIDYFTDAVYIGSDNSPEVPVMLSIIQAAVDGFEDSAPDIFAVLDGEQAENAYMLVEKLLAENGYHLPDASAIRVVRT